MRAHPLIAVLREERRTQGISQSRLALRIGVHNAQVCQWEKGERRPMLDNFVAFANALGFELELVRKGTTP